MKKLKCIPGSLKLDISPCPQEVKYTLMPELAKLMPYPGTITHISFFYIYIAFALTQLAYLYVFFCFA